MGSQNPINRADKRSILQVHGARTHTLNNVSLRLPTDGVVVFCGVSGSGKSSFVLDTVHSEGRRRYLQAIGLVANWPIPDVDLVTGVPPTIALGQASQRRRGTLATASDLASILAVLVARCGVLHCPSCDCALPTVVADQLVDEVLAQFDSERLLIEAPITNSEAVLEEVARAGFGRIRLNADVLRLEQCNQIPKGASLRVVVDRVKVSADRTSRLYDSLRMASDAGDGEIVLVVGDTETVRFTKPNCRACNVRLPPLTPASLHRFGQGACPDCHGRGDTCCENSGLHPVARAVRFRGQRFADLLQRPLDWWSQLKPENAVEKTVLRGLRERIQPLLDLGVGYLPPGRSIHALSMGEWQLVRLARVTGAAVQGALVILDEPTAGLDEMAVDAVKRRLADLRARGNGVWIISHRTSMLSLADRVVEFGPGAGSEGGDVIFDGTYAAFCEAKTKTSQWLQTLPAVAPSAPPVFAPEDIESGKPGLYVLCGPNGSGKSRLLAELQADFAARGFERCILDGGQAGRSERACPATYTGIWTTMRNLLANTPQAKIQGLKPAHFSLSKKGGRCERCKGLGAVDVELGPLPSVELQCPVCRGARFTGDVLSVRYKGRHARGWLEATVADARATLSNHPKLARPLGLLCDLGLGHLPMGQSTGSLSGGESRRLHLAREWGRALGEPAAVLLLLDAPTVGLHPMDALRLAERCRLFADNGGTIVVACHSPALVALADGILRLETRRDRVQEKS